MRRAVVLVLTMLAVTLVGGQLARAAAPPYDPNVARTASPALACASIPRSLDAVGLKMRHLDAFDEKSCRKGMAQRTLRVDSEQSPWDICAAREAEGLRYPHTFNDDPVQWVLPDLVARNRGQCGNAVYATWLIESVIAEADPRAGG